MLKTAIRFMRYDKSKSIGVIIGIVISIFLIGQQLGILGFLTGLMGGLIDNSRADIGEIWVVDNITQNANELGPLDERLVQEVRSIPGVKMSYAVVVSSGLVKFENGKTASVLLIGSEAPVFVAGPEPSKIIEGSLTDLSLEGAISAEFYDEKVFDNSVDIGRRVEINGKEAFIRVQTQNARGFAGSFFYTTLSKARYYGRVAPNTVNAIAVQVAEGYDKKAVHFELYG